MFVREKTINGYTYLYLVASVREGTRTKQQIIKNLGRKEAVLASGELERLAASVARFADRAPVLSAIANGNPDGRPRLPPHRCAAAVWPLVARHRHPGRAGRAAGPARLRVPARAGGVHRHPAPPDGVRLRPRL
jgi:hypothetical protein